MHTTNYMPFTYGNRRLIEKQRGGRPHRPLPFPLFPFPPFMIIKSFNKLMTKLSQACVTIHIGFGSRAAKQRETSMTSFFYDVINFHSVRQCL